MLKLYN